MKKDRLDRAYYELISTALVGLRTSEQEDRHLKVFQLFKKVFYVLTEKEKIDFSSLFSRISYVTSSLAIRGKLLQLLHIYRKENEEIQSKFSDEELYEYGVYIVSELIENIWHQKVLALPTENQTFYKTVKGELNLEIKSFLRSERAILQSLDKQHSSKKVIVLKAIIESKLGAEINVVLKLDQVYKENISLINYIISQDAFPTTVMLLDVSVDKHENYLPNAILWEPDYLVEVTGISECFNGRRQEPIKYILHKLLPTKPNPYLLAGNIINFFLDQLLYDSERSYEDLRFEAFKMFPLDFVLLKDSEVDVVLDRISTAYQVLQNAIRHEFSRQNITHEHAILEPTFLSTQYGIQGRLDLFHSVEKEKRADIIELKSGSPFMPNVYGLSRNHFIQTLMYDLLISSSHPDLVHKKNYILYARDYEAPLKYAPAIRSQQIEALLLRNQLIIIEDFLRKLDDSNTTPILDRINIKNQSQLTGYVREDVIVFEKLWSGLAEIEKCYAKGLLGMIAREQHLAKVGTEGINGNRGMASFWLQSIQEKEENYNILRHLRIIEDNSKQDNPLVVLEKSAVTNKLANFRKGDIVILYMESVVRNHKVYDQIFKSTIIHIDAENVIIRLRARQCGISPFALGTYWNLEPDLLDSSFSVQYQNVIRWMKCDKTKRQLSMGISAPKRINDKDLDIKPEILDRLTENQLRALKKMILAEDYFLLWGPPGTGKTSMMLRSFVEYLYENTEETILLLAYTNRAVDEICDAIFSIEQIDMSKVVRLGSRYGVGGQYRELLIQEQIQDAKSRNEIKTKLASYRIFVSTVASFTHKQKITRLVSYDRVIIDESSQLLDPMILPIMARFNKITLIGDHKQLPAIVTQREENTIVGNPDLQHLGYKNYRISLFERLFMRAKEENWSWAYDILHEQGRMHQEIMNFASHQFYEGELTCVPIVKRLTEDRFSWTWNHSLADNHPLSSICHRRVVYLHSQLDDLNLISKSNQSEAEMIVSILQLFEEYTDIDLSEVGIITPYRAQIALINYLLAEADFDSTEKLTIDTVERYQGSAKNIIIISLCANQLYQLEANKLSSDEIDRKLNVAITRAREQLIVIGNRDILSQVDDYSSYIRYAEELN